MTQQASWSRRAAPFLLPIATAALAAAIFVAELMTSEKLTAALFYVLVVLLAARFCNARGVVLVGAGCVALTILANFLPTLGGAEVSAIKTTIGAAVIGLTTFLALDRKRAEQALREGEEQWREVFEHNPVMYFMVGASGTVLSVNGFGADQLGYTPPELIGQSVLKVFFEEDHAVVKAHVATCLEEVGRSHNWEIRKVCKDGSVIWVRENAKAVRRLGSDPIVLIACEDITERRRAARRRDTLYAVAHILAEADSLASAAPYLLRAIGENLEWDWGAFWSVARAGDREGHTLRCECLWHAPHIEAAEFANFDMIRQKRTFAAGQGRLGQVWRSGLPTWMVDATTEPGFLRASEAARAGLHGAVIFPILLDADALGVAEFFSRAPQERDEEQLATLSAIGSQIGQFIKRRRAEAALRANEERWRKLFETSSVGMGLFQLDGLCTAANPALQRMLGRAEKEIVGRNVLELNHEDERAATADALAQYRSGSLTERRVEKKYLKKDGSPIWLDITNTLVPATETAAPFLQAVYVDVTERVQFEAALRASEGRWRAIFETSAVGIATGDLDGGVLSMNPTFQRMLGYTEDEFRNLTVFEFTHEDDLAETRRFFSGIVTGQKTSYRLEKRYRRKDGANVWADVSASMVPATDATPAFLAVMAVDITDRKRAEAAFRASEERWRAIFDSAAVGVAAGDLRGGLFNVNPTFQRMLGYTEEELRNLRAFEFTHEDDRAETRRLFSRVVSGQQPSYRLEKRYRRKDGAIVWVDVSASTVPATENTPAFLAVMAVDITERKEAEAALREAEERFRTLVQFSFDVYWESDADHRFIRQEFAEGLADAPPPGSEIGKTRWEVPYLEPDAEAWRKHQETLDAHLPFRDFEHARPTPDGGKRYVSVSGLPVFDETGRFIGYRGVGRHITDRKRAEAALRASEERWRAMFETAPVGIATIDFEQRRYLTANQSFQRMTGYTEAELRSLTTLELTHEDDRAAMQERIDSGAVGILQRKRYRRKDGEVVWADVTSFVVPATDSTPAFRGTVIVDITDRKRAEAALQQAQADLERLNRVMLLGEMTSSIAHEVNQPISAVITNADAGLRWLGARPPNLEEARQTLARIVRDGNRAGEVIDRVRALTTKVPPRRDRLELGEVIREVIALTQGELQRNEVRLQTRIADGLPLVAGDRVQLQQVIINLIINAVEAMNEVGDRPRELTIVAGRGDSNELSVEVRDTGPGLDQTNLDRLFHSFYTTKPDGMGMGLAISRSIVEAHGGRLAASPNDPNGAVFRLTLPVEPPAAVSSPT